MTTCGLATIMNFFLPIALLSFILLFMCMLINNLKFAFSNSEPYLYGIKQFY
jgi:hypothetical protein